MKCNHCDTQTFLKTTENYDVVAVCVNPECVAFDLAGLEELNGGIGDYVSLDDALDSFRFPPQSSGDIDFEDDGEMSA